METTTVEQPGTVAIEQPSTVLDPGTTNGASGAGKPDLREPAEKQSIESVLDAELARMKEEDAKAEAETKEKAGKATEDAKAKVEEKEKTEAKEPKPEEKTAKARDESGKFTKADKVEDQPADKAADKGAAEKPAAERSAPEDNRQSEGRKYAEPPARFLPEARTKWANVPDVVKAEFHRLSQEMETELDQSKAARERYEPIRQFDEIARSNGRELKDSLAKVVQIEQHIARDPIGAIDTILREIGPRKQDGSPVSLYEVAQVVMQRGPQALAPSIPQQQGSDPKVSILEREINSLKSQIATASVTPVIERFASQHTDYHTLEPQIAAVLKSGVIDQIYGPGLQPDQKLEQAYRMAGGTMSPSRSEPETGSAHSEVTTAPSRDVGKQPSIDAGTKSVRGAPANGADTAVEEATTDLTELLRKEYRRMSA
ncbi:MAG: hypothetical protein ACTHJQ_00275 [Rhizobiaceae bacterium]